METIAAEFREERAQTLRRQMLLTRGIHHGRGGIGEKFISQISQQHGHGHVHDGRCLDGSTGTGGGLHQRNITPENSASAGSGAMYKENEIGVALTTGMDVGVGIVASPSLGPMTPTSVSASGAGREIPVGGLNMGMGSRMNVNQGGATGVGVGGGGRDEVEYGVEMDVLGFLQRGR